MTSTRTLDPELLHTYEGPTSPRIIVGVYGSSEPVAVFRWAGRTAHLTSAPIEVITTWQPRAALSTAMPSASTGGRMVVTMWEAPGGHARTLRRDGGRHARGPRGGRSDV